MENTLKTLKGLRTTKQNSATIKAVESLRRIEVFEKDASKVGLPEKADMITLLS